MMDKELKAMAAIQRTIYALAPTERQRVLAWIEAKGQEGSWHDDTPAKASGTPAPNGVVVEPAAAPEAVLNVN